MTIKKFSWLNIALLTSLFCFSVINRVHAVEYDDYPCPSSKVTSVTDCLEKHLKKLRVKYTSLKKLVTQQMVELDAATLRDDALKTYQASEKSFQIFLRQNCAWHAANVMMGGINGQHNALQCEIRLIQLRLEELRTALGH